MIVRLLISVFLTTALFLNVSVAAWPRESASSFHLNSAFSFSSTPRLRNSGGRPNVNNAPKFEMIFIGDHFLTTL